MATSEEFDHLIIGGGLAAAKAVEGIRSLDRDGTIVVLGDEPDPPVYRPDLSKKLWLEDADPDGSELDVDGPGVSLRLQTHVTALDPKARTVTLADGASLAFGNALLATGSTTNKIEGLPPGERVVYYRTLGDYRHVRRLARSSRSMVVVGGGYIGTEMAAALTHEDVELTLVTPDELVLAHMLPEPLARRVTEAFRHHGVSVEHGRVGRSEVTDDGVRLGLDTGNVVAADAAVVGVGVAPRTGLAEKAGLTVDDGGVVVDDHLRTSAPDVYAAGDIALYPDALLGRRRVEHADAAETMGEAAGKNMAGADEAYTHTPFFWSDLFDDGYEAVGQVSTKLDTVEDFPDDDFAKGVVYYLDDGRVRGVLLWNVWDSVPKAEQVIRETAQSPVTDPDSLKGRIPLG